MFNRFGSGLKFTGHRPRAEVRMRQRAVSVMPFPVRTPSYHSHCQVSRKIMHSIELCLCHGSAYTSVNCRAKEFYEVQKQNNQVVNKPKAYNRFYRMNQRHQEASLQALYHSNTFSLTISLGHRLPVQCSNCA